MSRIVVFDSGVGGLSVYQEIVKKCPNHDYFFVSDNQAFPYGTKAEQELIERVLRVVQTIEQQYQPDLLVVACNTASTVALPFLRDSFNFTIVGVVPAIKPAAIKSQSNTIGLLATPGTIARSYTQNLINEFASQCNVIKVGSSTLVEIAEQKLYGHAIEVDEIEQQLTPFFDAIELDVLVLACTHFPLLNKEIEFFFNLNNHPVSLIDSGFAIANRVAELCPEPISKQRQTKKVAVFTGIAASEELMIFLKKLGFNKLEQINLI